MKKKAVVLLSGGLDSTINLYSAYAELEVLLALTFNYGQKAYEKEYSLAKKSCDQLGVKHKAIDLTWFKDFTTSSLVNLGMEVPTGNSVSIDSFEQSEKTAKLVWVPNRNGIFLNIAAGFAEGLGAEYVIPGFNIEEAATFPDNSSEFMVALNQSFSFSTSNHVKVKCFTDKMNKTEIVRLGHSLKVQFDYIWPCYFAGQEKCNECESCKRYDRAIREA